MATAQIHGVFIYSVGLLYASLGFSLSVLAALFGIFYPFFRPTRARSFHPRRPRKLPRPRISRSFSDQTRKVTVPKPPEHIEKERTHDVKSLRRRSKTLIPIIMIDHFGSTNSPGFLNLLPNSVSPAKSSLLNPDDAAVDSSNMSRPTIKRRFSSPLIRPRPTSQDSLPVPSREESNSSPNKVTRKSPGFADLNNRTFTMKFDSIFLRKAGKKSLTLRTQPCGPPHFCMPPLPIPNRDLRTASPGHDIQ